MSTASAGSGPAIDSHRRLDVVGRRRAPARRGGRVHGRAAGGRRAPPPSGRRRQPGRVAAPAGAAPRAVATAPGAARSARRPTGSRRAARARAGGVAERVEQRGEGVQAAGSRRTPRGRARLGSAPTRCRPGRAARRRRPRRDRRGARRRPCRAPVASGGRDRSRRPCRRAPGTGAGRRGPRPGPRNTQTPRGAACEGQLVEQARLAAAGLGLEQHEPAVAAGRLARGAW